MIRKPELLAPAGSIESLKAAVDNGADAVYFGIGSYNARANAENISEDNLDEAIQYAHLRSTKVYLALNTLLRDDELSDALRIASLAYDAGVDAVLVQDIGLLSLLRQELPRLPIHASTQMNLFQKDFGEWAREMGIERVVLPRELSLEAIAIRTSMAMKYDVETEVFVHGAVCVSYSGQCLFSAMNGNGMRSGNRGQCAQPCRTKLSLVSEEGKTLQTGRLLSPKDQCAMDSLRELMEAGVSSVKIEGRMRDAAYTAATVRSYRQIIDQLINGERPSSEEEKEHLLLAFNRGGGFTSQYLRGYKSPDFQSGDYPGRYGIKIGHVVKKEPKTGYIFMRIEKNSLPERGDYVSLRNHDIEIASFPIGSSELCGDNLLLKGLHPSLIEKIPDGTEVYRMSEKNRDRVLLSGKDSRKTPVHVSLTSSSSGIKANLVVSEGMWKGLRAETDLPIEPIDSYPELDQDRIKEQFSKMKSSPFQVDSVMVAGTNWKIPVSSVNELRRLAIAQMIEKIIEQKHSIMLNEKIIPKQENLAKDEQRILSGIHVNYQDLRKINTSAIFVGADVYSFSPFDLADDDRAKMIQAGLSTEPDAKIYMWMPSAYSDRLLAVINKARSNAESFLGKSYQGLVTGVISELRPRDIVSPAANIYNAKALESINSLAPASIHLSYEIKERELDEILLSHSDKDQVPWGLSIHRYGRINWMTTEFCPIGKNAEGCSRCKDKEKSFSLKVLSQETNEPVAGKTLPLIPHPENCSCEILGSLLTPISAEFAKMARSKGVSVLNTIRFYDEPFLIRREIVDKTRATG